MSNNLYLDKRGRLTTENGEPVVLTENGAKALSELTDREKIQQYVKTLRSVEGDLEAQGFSLGGACFLPTEYIQLFEDYSDDEELVPRDILEKIRTGVAMMSGRKGESNDAV